MSSLELKVTPIDQSATLKERTYKALKAAIEQMNIYDKNAQLRLDERQLSTQFGISRTPLREALARLEHEGLIRTIPRRGVFLLRKSKQDILEMITLWAALESMAARIITLEASDAEIGTLRELVEKYEDQEVDANLDEYSDANIEFHQRILKLSKCKILEETAADLFMHVRAIRARTIGEDNRAFRSVIDHSHIIEALEARDTEEAERLVREHTLNLRAHVERHLDLSLGEAEENAQSEVVA
ncbi:MAG: GntR family transcriptional regulator [Rhodospirillales bacterium]|jgi:DNA-binding GntR family transcriptional regulator